MKFIDKIKYSIRRGGFGSVPNERTFLYRHLSDLAKTLKGKRILDVGAGVCQYKHLLANDNKYESCDLENGFHPDQKHDFIASVYSIPQSDNTYDIVLLLQVLEHLEFPLKGLAEVNRILKVGGKVFITVPQAAGDHFEPYHYFNYTRYGLASVLQQTGFEIEKHERLAGMFVYVANRVEKLGVMIYNQHKNNILGRVLGFVFMYFCKFVGLILPWFDFLDKKKTYCIGHAVLARKVQHFPKASS